MTDPTELRFVTRESTLGENYRVRVTVGPQVVLSEDRVNFPASLPTITRVSGCNDEGAMTKDCPTRGGVMLTIEGSNFGSYILFSVFVCVVCRCMRRICGGSGERGVRLVGDRNRAVCVLWNVQGDKIY